MRASIDAVITGASRIVITRDGAPVAALVTPDDLLRLQNLDEQRRRDFAVLEAFAEGFTDVPQEELEREVAKAVAEARAEIRAEREAAERAARPI